MKNLRQMKRAKQLKRNELKKITGGIVIYCDTEGDCIPGWGCVRNRCVRGA